MNSKEIKKWGELTESEKDQFADLVDKGEVGLHTELKVFKYHLTEEEVEANKNATTHTLQSFTYPQDYLLTADDARGIAKTTALDEVKDILEEVQEAASKGKFNVRLDGVIKDPEYNSLIDLGFNVFRYEHLNRTVISW